MADTPNYELLKDAYAIIDGIPDDVINLADIVLKRGRSLSCGTVCCAAGWLAYHPQFQALGLAYDERRHGELTLNGESYSGRYVGVMQKLFNLHDVAGLFHSRQISEQRGALARLTDKQLFLLRVREFLADHGQL